MKLSKRVLTLAATPILAAATLTATAGSANAINSVDCTRYDFTWVLSNQTTCWANAGGQAVRLYSTFGANTGANAGFLRFDSGAIQNFARWSSPRWSPQTVNYIAIY